MELVFMEEVYVVDCLMIFRVKGDDFIKKKIKLVIIFDVIG